MATRKDPNDDNHWHVEITFQGQRIHRRLPKGSTARDAKRVESELTRSLHLQIAPRAAQIPGDPLLTDVMAEYTEKHALTLRSPETAQHHAYRIGKWLEGRRVSEIRQVAARIRTDLLKAYAPATVNRSLGTLKKALSLAWQYGDTPIDYSGLVKRVPEHNQRTVYLSMEEVKHLASHASEPVRAAIWIALLTGCRRGEICKIVAADIGNDKIRIQAGNTKTLRYREVPIVPALQPWLEHLPLKIDVEGVKSGFRRARVAAKMPHVNFHDLRHSCATIMLDLGVELHVVREILGHTSIKTTERYAHVMVKPQRAALEKLGALQLAAHE